MFLRKRTLKKERPQKRFKTILIMACITLVLLLFSAVIYIFLPFGRTNYISPLAKENNSKILVLENELGVRQIEYSAVNASPDGSFLIVLKSGGEVILSSKKDIRAEVSSLQLILSRLTIEGKKLKVLDFRFAVPVISFN